MPDIQPTTVPQPRPAELTHTGLFLEPAYDQTESDRQDELYTADEGHAAA